ncbi:hypothetical protein NPIL_123631 [Nephila pilipes]|uniref:Uncharacterized protein n=1 Tax=Nephila pilipes TaxID=299642 RepID=A0A8X6MV71_NEPPI|nr:hypothetical protein NPIL_123631 [Nephila pilipes]
MQKQTFAEFVKKKYINIRKQDPNFTLDVCDIQKVTIQQLNTIAFAADVAGGRYGKRKIPSPLIWLDRLSKEEYQEYLEKGFVNLEDPDINKICSKMKKKESGITNDAMKPQKKQINVEESFQNELRKKKEREKLKRKVVVKGKEKYIKKKFKKCDENDALKPSYKYEKVQKNPINVEESFQSEVKRKEEKEILKRKEEYLKKVFKKYDEDEKLIVGLSPRDKFEQRMEFLHLALKNFDKEDKKRAKKGACPGSSKIKKM